ncbi:MAG: acetyl-CoA carboxylase carboxyl transferase subunit beta, partial [Psychrobacter okhotskensis]
MSQLVDKPLMMANNMTDTITKPDMTTPNNTEKTNAEPNGNTAGQSWFNRPIPGIKQQLTAPLTAVETEPSTKCSNCHSMITNTALIFNCYVCPHCDHHLPMSARERLHWILDQVDGELGQEFTAKDPLRFVDSKPYPKRMSEAQEKTGESEALIAMYGKLRNLDVVAC